MQYAEQTTCSAEGCSDKRGRGKTMCWKHVREMKPKAVISDDVVSSCHGVRCTKGEKHDYGEQYCSKCKEACLWKPAMR